MLHVARAVERTLRSTGLISLKYLLRNANITSKVSVEALFTYPDVFTVCASPRPCLKVDQRYEAVVLVANWPYFSTLMKT